MVRKRFKLYADAVEDPEGREALVVDVDQFLIVGLSGLEEVDLAEYLFVERDVLGMGDADGTERIFLDGEVVLLRLVAGVALDGVVEDVAAAQRVRLEEIVALAEVVVAKVAEICCTANAFIFQRRLRG